MSSASMLGTEIGWRTPCRLTDATRSRWASESNSLRGWVGSGRMRVSSMEYAPASRSLPSIAPCAGKGGLLGSLGSAPNVRSAAIVAAAADAFNAAEDFVEEASGDGSLVASGGVEGDGDAVGDTLLELCQIGNHV